MTTAALGGCWGSVMRGVIRNLDDFQRVIKKDPRTRLCMTDTQRNRVFACLRRKRGDLGAFESTSPRSRVVHYLCLLGFVPNGFVQIDLS
jgi:hypothetical protein